MQVASLSLDPATRCANDSWSASAEPRSQQSQAMLRFLERNPWVWGRHRSGCAGPRSPGRVACPRRVWPRSVASQSGPREKPDPAARVRVPEAPRTESRVGRDHTGLSLPSSWPVSLGVAGGRPRLLGFGSVVQCGFAALTAALDHCRGARRAAGFGKHATMRPPRLRAESEPCGAR